MTKIITQKNPRRQASQITQKNHQKYTNCWVSGSQIQQENAVEEVRKQTKEEEWRDGLAEKGAGNVQLNRGKNGG
jgi:ABC-type metal ion transport system substrate-binding protein